MKKCSLVKAARLTFFSSILLVPSLLLAQDGLPHHEKGLSREQLTGMRERMSREHPDAAAGILKVIENFEQADTNKDDLLSPQEFKTYAEANDIKMPPPPEGHGQRHRGPKAMSKEQFLDLRNHIEQVEGAAPEAFDLIIANFDAVDANDDGLASPDEVRTYADENGIEMPPPPPPHGVPQGSPE